LVRDFQVEADARKYGDLAEEQVKAEAGRKAFARTMESVDPVDTKN